MQSRSAQLDVEDRMALRCFGYGQWTAPFWFIGPEQGQSRSEANDLEPRISAWLQLGASELTDCRAFHDLLPNCHWHRDSKPPLQATWRYLMLLLLTYLDQPSDPESRRTYQRDHWGRQDCGETCVIELSGLPANSFKVSRNREQYRHERIRIIRERIQAHRPRLVVMYGQSDRQHWNTIAGTDLIPNVPKTIGPTTFLFAAPHPTAPGTTNAHWIRLGTALRSLSKADAQEKLLH
jgi:hypothetical protein